MAGSESDNLRVPANPAPANPAPDSPQPANDPGVASSASPVGLTPRHLILGTAGHIDHGKTSLVRALTGTETDRLPEEKRRGMTIELGFAELRVKSVGGEGDLHFGIVDVPGHERFVRTMVAGATGIDVALIVVAADDSVMPQTVEHVEILNLLGVRRAVVAITKIDTVDEEMVELVTEDILGLLEGSRLEASPVCRVSSVTGAGIAELKETIRTVAMDVAPRPAASPFHMAIDRVFTVPGRGTVVTGSALRGSVASGDQLEVLPKGLSCRVRDLQSHGQHHERVSRSQRTAINISGVDRDELPRGSVLATPGYLTPSRVIGVRLHCLSSSARGLKSTGVVRLSMGTSDMKVRVVLLDRKMLEPGESTVAELRSAERLAPGYGQRFIIRDENATRTIGGGVVLDPCLRRGRRDRAARVASLRCLDTGTDEDRVEQVLRAAGFHRPTDAQLCARAGVELADVPAIVDQLREQKRWIPIGDSQTFVVPAALDDVSKRVTRRLERYHRDHPELPGRHVDAVVGWLERLAGKSLAKPLLDRFLREGILKTFGHFICLPKFAPALSAADEKYLESMVNEIRTRRFQPPGLGDLSIGSKVDRKRLVRLATLAVAAQQLVSIDGKLYLHGDVERELRETVRGLIDRHGGVTVAQVREALDSSRKFVVPFLEYLDRAGFTKRVEDRRVLAE